MLQIRPFHLVPVPEANESTVLKSLKPLRTMRIKRYLDLTFLSLTLLVLIIKLQDRTYALSTKEYSSETLATKHPRQPELLFFELSTETRFTLEKSTFECTIVTATCSISCHRCKVESLQRQFEDLYSQCEDMLNIHLEYCDFPGEIISTNAFLGNYQIRNLTIDNANRGLWRVDDNAFAHNTTATIETLILLKTQFSGLNVKSFNGLRELKHFKMTNYHCSPIGNHFLKPMAKTMESLTVQLGCQTQYEPGPWFGIEPFDNLHFIDISSNTFPNTLTKTSFQGVPHVEDLLLSASNIEVIADGTFEPLIPALQHLDLSNNKLKRLNGEFLNAIEAHGLNLELFGNPWNCTCDNEILITAIQNVNMKFGADPKCDTPVAFIDVALNKVDLDCLEAETTTIPTTDTTTSTVSTTEPDSGSSTQNTEPDSGSSTQNTTEIPSTETEGPLRPTTTRNKSPPIPTTTEAIELYNPVAIFCHQKSDDLVLEQFLRNYDVRFFVRSESATTVLVYIDHDMNKFGLVYFNHKNITQSGKIMNNNILTAQVSVVTKKQIFDLESDQSYVFCIIPDLESRISPFNCQSHHSMYLHHIEKWLSNDDRTLFYALATLGVVLFLITGVCSIYFLLRCNPTWVLGSKRLLRPNQKSRQEFLMPKKMDDDYIYSVLRNCDISNNARTSEILLNTNDYMEYYRSVLRTGNEITTSTTETLAPTHLAPPIPSTKVVAHPKNHSSNSYEPMGFYEEII